MTQIIPRALDLYSLLKKKGIFLFGPRQTGKTALIKQTLFNQPEIQYYNLLDSKTFLDLSSQLNLLKERLQSNTQMIVIDEIQKLPHLLDEIHDLIESYSIKFLLTGSSPRKLHQKGVNLLGGRLRSRSFHPFIFRELKDQFNLHKALERGLIPSIYFSDSYREDLSAYCGDYLKEEISYESEVRNLPAFSRFLQISGIASGQQINFSQMANDSQVNRQTLRSYYDILKDTLIIHEVLPWEKGLKRKAVSISKFYYFDVGLVRFLQGKRGLEPHSSDYGEAFEHYIYHEIKTWVDIACAGDGTIEYWRTQSGIEVDFILNNEWAIEVKAKKNIFPRELKGLRAIKDEKAFKKYYLVCFEEHMRKVDHIEIVPWDEFLKLLWEYVPFQ